MNEQKPQVNMVVVLSLAIGIPALTLGGHYAIQFGKKSLTSAPNKILEGLFGEIKPSAKPVHSTHDLTPDPVNITAEQFDATLAACKNSLMFLDWQFKNKVNTEFDAFVLPNGPYGKVNCQWSQVYDANGNPIMKPGLAKAPPSRFSPGRYELELTDANAVATRAAGRLKITVPLSWDHVSLGVDETGKTKQSGSISAALKQCQNDYYQIEISGDLRGKKVVHFARDATGQRLKWSSKRKSGNTIIEKSKGQVRRVELFVCRQQHTVETDFVAYAKPKSPPLRSRPAPPIPAPRYEKPGIEWNFATISKQELLKQTQVLCQRCEAWAGYNDPKIRVCLPPVANSWLATIDFGKKDICKAFLRDGQDQPVPCNIEYGCFGDTEGGTGKEIRFRPPKGAKKGETIQFNRIKGEVRIRYPAAIQRVVLTKDKPQAGPIRAEFDGCRAMVSGWNWPGDTFPDPEYSPIRAYDRTGNRIKQLSVFDQQYWGYPERVELLDVTQWIEVTIPFDLPPAELLEPLGS